MLSFDHFLAILVELWEVAGKPLNFVFNLDMYQFSAGLQEFMFKIHVVILSMGVVWNYGFYCYLTRIHIHTEVCLNKCFQEVPAKMSEDVCSVNRIAAHTLTVISYVWQSGDGWKFPLFWDFFFSLDCGNTLFLWFVGFFFCYWPELLHTGDLTDMMSSAVPHCCCLISRKSAAPFLWTRVQRLWFWTVGRSCPRTLILMSGWQ